jgi:hypothetical protein
MRYSGPPTCLLGLLLACGCSRPLITTGTVPSRADAEEQVKAAFAAVQKALKEHNADDLWALLDEDSRSDAERTAEAWQEAAKDKSRKTQDELGLSADAVAKLSAKDFLKSKPFLGKYDELVTSKLDEVSVHSDQAVARYTEADGDKEKLDFSYVGGQWKVRLRMPKVP